jgi:hypothetical protein
MVRGRGLEKRWRPKRLRELQLVSASRLRCASEDARSAIPGLRSGCENLEESSHRQSVGECMGCRHALDQWAAAGILDTVHVEYGPSPSLAE